MSVENWNLVQRAYNLVEEPGASISKRNRRALYSPTDQFLRKEVYLRFLPRKRPTRTAAKPVTPVDALAEIERRLVDSDKFLMDSLCDPDESVAKKQERRERWLADPANKDRPRPWEGTAPHGNGVSAHPTAPVPASPTGSK